MYERTYKEKRSQLGKGNNFEETMEIIMKNKYTLERKDSSKVLRENRKCQAKIVYRQITINRSKCGWNKRRKTSKRQLDRQNGNH